MAADCFFCQFLGGQESEWNRFDDIVLRSENTTAFVSPRWWPRNAGAAIVVPNAHVPDLESMDNELLAEVYRSVKLVAQAMRAAYSCEGTSTRQHNGSPAGQEIDHMHVHVFPRYPDDDLYARDAEHRFAAPDERRLFAEELRSWIDGPWLSP
jgi:histidine triad (HIT) family protein